MLEWASAQKLRQIPYIFPRHFGRFGNEADSTDSALLAQRRIHIYGAPKVGKTAFALYLARHFNAPFYVDFGDLRNTQDTIKTTLLKISMEKKIDMLILDNCPHNFALFPQVPHIITINARKMSGVNLALVEIAPLNFEEFVSFDKSNKDIAQLFDSFIKQGNLPEMGHFRGVAKLERKQEILKLIFGENLPIMREIAAFHGQKLTINHIYTTLKKSLKTSKDSIYRLLGEWQEMGALYFIPALDSPKSPKKLMFWDWSVASALGYAKNFNAIVENMLFLELKSRAREICYAPKLSFVADGVGYAVMAFESAENIKRIAQKLPLGNLSEVVVITLENEGEFVAQGRKCKVRSFINFALE